LANRPFGDPALLAALILGACVVAAALIVQSSIEGATTELSKLLVAIQEAPVPGAAPAPRPAARPGRPDPNRRHDIDIGGSPRKGSAEAKVTVVEFSDFQCPFCARVGPTLAQIEDKYGDRVQIAFKHLPLRIHSKAPAAHAAAEAAHRQGKFWEMHDKIFENQREMSPQSYEAYAVEMELDMEQFKKDIGSSESSLRFSKSLSCISQNLPWRFAASAARCAPPALRCIGSG
jgi:protein-disulfide isomerase